jgi:hypothetical protein
MNRRPKVAVALYGLPRCSAVAAPSIETQIIAPLREWAEVRVYYHLFLQQRIDNPRSGEFGELDPANYDFVRNYEGRLESPPDVTNTPMYNALQQRGDRYGDGGKSIRNLLLQLHSLAEVGALAMSADPDVVVYARSDLQYHDPIEMDVIRYAFHHPKVCALPGWQWWYGCNDRFAICGRAAAPLYAHRGMLLENYCRRTRQPLEAEELLMYALRCGRLSVVALPLRASRVRLGGRLQDETFTGRTLRYRGFLGLYWARLAYTMIPRTDSGIAP